MFVCLCFTSLQQRGHLETAPLLTVPCEGREAFYHVAFFQHISYFMVQHCLQQINSHLLLIETVATKHAIICNSIILKKKEQSYYDLHSALCC